MTRPRVLQVILSLCPGGTERLLIELIRRLNAEIEMMVCCLDAPGEWAPQLQAFGIEVTSLGRQSGFRPGLGHAIAGQARKYGATIVHAHQYSPFVYSALARIWQPAMGVVFTEHGRLSDAPPSGKRRLANRVLSKLPRRVFAVSENLRRHLISEGFAPDAVQVIYNGIDVGDRPEAKARRRVRDQLGTSDDTLVIGTIARLDRVKDLGTLLRAMSLISRRRPVMLLIIGDGPERAKLERLGSDLGISSHVRFLGHRDDAREWLAGFDVYVNSSVSEGISLTILEAMAAGLPVVATRVGGTPEVVIDNCGRLVEARDAGGLATALQELAREPALRSSLGAAARQRAELHFNIDRMVRQYRDVYVGAR